MKVLNLDALAAKTESRSVTLGGETHDIAEMTVENYIQTTLDSEKLEQAESTVADQIQATIRMIQRSIPTVKEATLQRLTLDQLRILVSFVRGEDVEENKPEAEAEPGGEEKK